MKAQLTTFVLALVMAGGCGAPAPSITPAGSPPSATARPATVTPTFAEPASPSPDPFAQTRLMMVETQMRRRDISDEAVLRAMEAVPRHEFVPADFLDQAYNDHPLPIGYGQTISQPYIVALMTELLDLSPTDKVLEIGTGSGYQAAVLAELTDQVYTIEIIPQLAERAQATFDRLGYDEITAKQADGYWGWEEYAPFEAIIVTAAPDHVPQPLLNQMAEGGRLVLPVGPPGGYQSLWLITRQGDEFLRYNWGGVRFVPLTRGE
ncbi:MAG: protein-L-isoaspartate(D-aspartate) O-methyltransferase [Anaerolineae bacterium]